MVEERRRARAACDLEGNRAGLGCLEHLGNALSFADALIVRLEPWREASRNSLWVSVMSILAAAGTQILLSAHHSLPLWSEVLVFGVLLGGTVLVPLTVRHFRRSFRPLLDEYHIRQPLRPQHDYHRHSEPEEEEEPYSA